DKLASHRTEEVGDLILGLTLVELGPERRQAFLEQPLQVFEHDLQDTVIPHPLPAPGSAPAGSPSPAARPVHAAPPGPDQGPTLARSPPTLRPGTGAKCRLGTLAPRATQGWRCSPRRNGSPS